MKTDAFGKYLASHRGYKAIGVESNPKLYADELLVELKAHLTTVAQWIDGTIDRVAMAKALQFFGGQYAAKGLIYRGGIMGESFDGKPASYSRKRTIAEGFAVANVQKHPGREFFVIKRKASSRSLDFGKLLKEYASGKHYRADESEVVDLHTRVSERNVTVYTT